MTKIEFVDAVAKETEWTKKDSEEAINAVVKVITNALVAGEKLSIVGFGTFEPRKRAARTGRNPQTGKEIKIAAKTVPAFSAGKKFKEAVAK